MELHYYHHKLNVQVASRKFNLGNYMFKLNYRNTRARCEICSKLTIKTPALFIVNFEHISHLVLLFLQLI